MGLQDKLEYELREAREWCDTLSDALAGSDPVGVPKGVLIEYLAWDEARQAKEASERKKCRVNPGKEPCIPAGILRGMVDRILLRVRVERDNREEAYEL
jgi:hypothetical protein